MKEKKIVQFVVVYSFDLYKRHKNISLTMYKNKTLSNVIQKKTKAGAYIEPKNYLNCRKYH